MIDKKTIFKSLIIILLLSIIIFAFIQIRKTLARYETTTATERDVDVAFWLVGNSFESQRILIDEIYPSDTPYEYTFTVSNFKESKIAETDLEYEITLTTTTNLPLEYEIQKNGVTCATYVPGTSTTQLIKDANGTYYAQMKLGSTSAPSPFVLDTIHDGNGDGKYENRKLTDTFVIKVTFPKVNSANREYADLIENIKIELSAKQIID